MANITRSATEYFQGLPGPYEAIVVGHLDPAFMGTLKVEILKKTSSGNDPERSGQLLEARYLSPFYGVTPQAATTGNSGYENSQKSYGFWAVPPDVGTRVIVMLIEGNISQAFWIGCVQDEYMNFMTPGYAATTQVENINPDNASDKIGKKVPTGEYNKRREEGTSKSPTKFAKPPHSDIINHLNEQGLIDDDIRGTTSSSARREVPSSVFGISTPGPLDKRTNAPKEPIGPVGAKANQFINRLGGTSFVMDDGDDKIIRKGPASSTPPEYENIEALPADATLNGDVTLPANELMRIRTRTGHQILLHNTEDLIYIGNARGTSWIEMTSNGKIDIYAQDSVSVHSSADVNFTADRDINFTAGENVNFVVGKDFKTTAGDGIHNTAGLNINNTAGQSISEIAGTHISNYAQMDASYQSIGNTVIGVGKDLDLSAGNNALIEAGNGSHIKSGCHSKMEVISGNFEMKAADLSINTWNVSWQADTVSWDADKFILYTTDQISFDSENTYFNSRNDTEITTSNDFYQIVDGRYGVRVDEEIKFQSKASIKLRANSDILTWSRGDTNMLVQGDWNVDCNSVASLTTEGTFNISSTNNSNATTPGGIAVVSAAGIEMKTIGGENFGGDFVVDSSWKVKIKTADTFGIDSGNQIQHKAANEIQLKGSKTELQPSADLPAVGVGNIGANAPDYVTDDDLYIIANPFISYVKWYKHDHAKISKVNTARSDFDLPPIFAIPPTPAIYADRVARIPMHEPWYQHENLDPLEFTPDKTRAGSELKDIYIPQMPDTFATTPSTQDTLSKSIIFDPKSAIEAIEADLKKQIEAKEVVVDFFQKDKWRNVCRRMGGFSEAFADGVQAVIVSQYGAWDYNRTETKPNYESDEENIIVCRKRYFNLRDKTDQQILEILEVDKDEDFFENVYGNTTAYGRALGNYQTYNDGYLFRGHGPYLGIIGRAAQQKVLKWAEIKSGVPFPGNKKLDPDFSFFNLVPYGHNLVLAGWLHNHYKDHGRNMLGNIRITLFGTENYDLYHQRDKYLYKVVIDNQRGVRETK